MGRDQAQVATQLAVHSLESVQAVASSAVVQFLPRSHSVPCPGRCFCRLLLEHLFSERPTKYKSLDWKKGAKEPHDPLVVNIRLLIHWLTAAISFFLSN